MNTSMQSYLVEMFTEKELRELLDDLYMDDMVDLLEELPANLVTRILDVVDHAKRTSINQLLNYPEDSDGSIMTTEYVSQSSTLIIRGLALANGVRIYVMYNDLRLAIVDTCSIMIYFSIATQAFHL